MSNPGPSSCPNPPCAAPRLGALGLTTVVGRDPSGRQFSCNEDIYGPFENGFGAQQNNILSRLGCSPASRGHVAGGIDTRTAEQIMARSCGIELPRREGANYISLLNECGSHREGQQQRPRTRTERLLAVGSGDE